MQDCARHKEKSILSERLPSFYREGFAKTVLQETVLFPPSLYAYQIAAGSSLVLFCIHQMSCVPMQFNHGPQIDDARAL